METLETKSLEETLESIEEIRTNLVKEKHFAQGGDLEEILEELLDDVDYAIETTTALLDKYKEQETRKVSTASRLEITADKILNRSLKSMMVEPAMDGGTYGNIQFSDGTSVEWKERYMDKLDKEEVLDTIDMEGFDYAFRYYSNFLHIEDEKFHELRKNYQEAADELEGYLEE